VRDDGIGSRQGRTVMAGGHRHALHAGGVCRRNAIGRILDHHTVGGLQSPHAALIEIRQRLAKWLRGWLASTDILRCDYGGEQALHPSVCQQGVDFVTEGARCDAQHEVPMQLPYDCGYTGIELGPAPQYRVAGTFAGRERIELARGARDQRKSRFQALKTNSLDNWALEMVI